MDTSTYYRICRWLKDITARTRWEGHLYAVGGCCRDQILGREIQDIDIAVDLPNGGVEFAKWLQHKGYALGKPVLFQKFGTAKVVTRAFPDVEIELVQTRSEKYTKENSRCPEVAFGSLEDDCFRRDFTANTLYYDITRERMLDMTGKAVDDIRSGILRTPMNPDMIFDDDPVRILRGIRFASRFGWQIDPEAYAAMRRNIDRLSIVSKERFHTELSKMLTSADPGDAFRRLDEIGAVGYANPLLDEYIRESGPEGKVPGGWKKQLDQLSRLRDLSPERRPVGFALAVMLSDMGKMRTRVKDRKGTVRYPRHELTGANMVRKMLRAMKFLPEDYDLAAFLILHHHATSEWGVDAEEMTDKGLRCLQRECGTPERLTQLLDFLDITDPENKGRHERVAERSEELEEEGTAAFATPENTAPEKKKRRGGHRRYRHRHTQRK